MTQTGARLLLLTALTAFAGCGRAPADNYPMAEARAQFLLAAEPEGAVSIVDAREELAGGGPIVLVGRVGGGEQSWVDGQAAFVMRDPSLDTAGEHGHECSDGDFPFCAKKRSKTDGLAVVHFLGANGKPVPVAARQLFDLNENATVVVRGKASVTPLGMLVVAASGIYVRR